MNIFDIGWAGRLAGWLNRCNIANGLKENDDRLHTAQTDNQAHEQWQTWCICIYIKPWQKVGNTLPEAAQTGYVPLLEFVGAILFMVWE